MEMREVIRQGMCWHVREMDSQNILGARGASCLIFDSDGVVRRVWTFPAMELGIVREQSRSLIQEQGQMLSQSARIRMIMQTAIESYAGTPRREGVAPEQALVLIKTATEDGLGGRNGRDEPGADELLREGVVRAITAYYAP